MGPAEARYADGRPEFFLPGSDTRAIGGGVSHSRGRLCYMMCYMTGRLGPISCLFVFIRGQWEQPAESSSKHDGVGLYREARRGSSDSSRYGPSCLLEKSG